MKGDVTERRLQRRAQIRAEREAATARIAARSAICDACGFKSGYFCTSCKCFLPVKIHGSGQKCPIGKW